MCTYCGGSFFYFALRTDPAHQRKCCSRLQCQSRYRLRADRMDLEEKSNRREASVLRPGDPAVLADGRFMGWVEHVDPAAGLVVVREKNSFAGWRTVYQARYLLPPERGEDHNGEDEACGLSS